MISTSITRRQLLAAGVNATVVVALGRFATGTECFAADLAETVTFYDPRFPGSEALARSLPGATLVQPAAGDPSLHLTHLDSGSSKRGGIRMQGVTTETVPFCLEQLARIHCRDVCLRSCRLSRDLFAWSLTVRAASPAAWVGSNHEADGASRTA